MTTRLFQAYSRGLARRPVLVQSATAAVGHYYYPWFNSILSDVFHSQVLYAVGDVIAQGTSAAVNVDESPKWDWQRTVRMTAIGGLALGPTMSIWSVYGPFGVLSS